MYNEPVNKQLFFEVWGGNSTLLQRRLIEEWLNVPGNVEIYYEWLDEWEKNNLQVFKDVNLSYQNFLTTRVNSDASDATYNLRKSNKGTIRLIAAAIIGVVLVISMYLSKDLVLYKSHTTAYGEILKVDLPDKSVVFLNANSTIKYPRFNFNRGTRKVYVSGEAEFEVVHTATNSPFEVHGDNSLKISVLGTKFVVYSRSDSTNVVLSEGRIELTKSEAGITKTLILKPGEQVVLSEKEPPSIKVVENLSGISSWKDREFVFEGTSLYSIGLQIKDVFGLTVNFESDELAQRTISGSFHADNAMDLVDALAQLLDLNYKTTESEIFFSE
jgi:ferric-dicitrate binding protein FerR (iron transport regulator)